MDNTSFKALIEFIAKTLVDQPDDVLVTESVGDQIDLIELRVNKTDIGKVIGKQGRTVHSIRTILNAASSKIHRRTELEVLE